MDWINVVLTSVSMSVDASTVGAVDGVNEKGMKKTKMALIALSFGLFQFVMPTIGYFLGFSVKDYIEDYIPWIAFSLLLILGIKSLIDWIKEMRNKEKDEIESKPITFKMVMIQSVATSIDALCVGFVFLDLAIYQAMLVFTIIGVTTFILSFLAIFLGNKISAILEKWGSLIAAIVFVAVGLKILLEGLL